VERELNDEIERLRNSKKRLRQNVEALTKEMNAKDGEIASLEKEVKRFIQVTISTLAFSHSL
jgi:HAMP domain-containing protein